MNRSNITENFSYTDNGDNLDRLTSVTGPQNLTMTYAANGNIKTKSDISSTVDFGYGTNAGPYALTGVTSSTNVIPSVAQAITYTSFESVATIGEGNYNAAIIYNSDNQRAKMDVTQSGTNILTRWYAGNSYMKETAGGVTKEYTYLGGDAYHAPVVAVTQGGTTNYFYLLRDYLGNITHQVNTSNVVVAEYNFDACSVKLGFCECSETKTVVELIPISEAGREGRRRDKDDWSYTLDGNDLALFADRGFTGHEYLPWFNLYNMNGRMYDPLVGRFLSADPYVQDGSLTQSYNRYSYCLNNPLRYTDYSGYTWGIFKPFVKAGKWVWNVGLPAIDPMNAFVNFMDWINNSTPETRQKMSELGIPDFGVGVNVGSDGNVNYNGSIYGHEVFNTANIDRSNAEQVVNKEIDQVRQDYGQAWHAASRGGFQLGDVINGQTITGFSGGMPLRDLRPGEGDPITGVAPTPGKNFRGGSILMRDGFIKSLPKDFQRWFHRFWKDSSAPNATKSEIDEALKIWKSIGKPKVK